MSPTPDPARTVATTGATPSSSVVGDLGSILLLTIGWVGMAIQVNPQGEFSLNDDWAYALPVKALTEQDSIRFTFWQSMTLIGQVLWGALFCLPGGFSFLALRLSVLTAGLAGVMGLYGLCRHIGSCTAPATLGSSRLRARVCGLPRKLTGLSSRLPPQSDCRSCSSSSSTFRRPRSAGGTSVERDCGSVSFSWC